MARYMIDTNIFIDFLNFDKKAKEFIIQNINHIMITFPVHYELLVGAKNKK
jgi:predicted nucleic acid-binding protein